MCSFKEKNTFFYSTKLTVKLQTLSWATANPSRLKNIFFCVSFSWARRPVSCSEKQALFWGAERWLNNVIIARVNLHCLSCLTHHIAVHKSMWTAAWNSHWPRQQSIVLLDVKWRRDALMSTVRMFGEEQTLVWSSSITLVKASSALIFRCQRCTDLHFQLCSVWSWKCFKSHKITTSASAPCSDLWERTETPKPLFLEQNKI